MNDWLNAVVGVAFAVAFWTGGWFMAKHLYRSQLQAARDELWSINQDRENAEQASKFRIRTVDDLSKLGPNARVRVARVRAYRSKTPPPRK